MYSGQLGVGITSWQRPSHLRNLLCDLEDQSMLGGAVFHLFQDGWDGGSDRQRVQECYNVWQRADLPKGYSVIRRDNVGCTTNNTEGRRVMADEYDAVLFLDNDIRVSKYYLKLARVVLDEVLDGSNDLFGFSLGTHTICDDWRINEMLDCWTYYEPTWVQILFWSDRLDEVDEYYSEYYDLVKDVRDSSERRDEVLELYDQHGFEGEGDAHDGGMNMAIHAAGLERGAMVVNRAVNVGERGSYSTPEIYQEYEFGQQYPYEFDSDSERFSLKEEYV